MNKPDNKVVDLISYRAKARGVKDLMKTDTSKLSQKELNVLVTTLGELVQQQTDLLNQSMIDLTLLNHNLAGMQNQFLLVSGQAHVALEMLKKKGICTPEEIDDIWQDLEKRINNITAPVESDTNVPD